MKKSLLLSLIVAALAGPAVARNTPYKLSWADVMESPAAKARLDGTVKFYFGEKTMPAGAERKGDDVVSRINQGTVRNDDISACKAAAVDALAALQERAKQVGANAVVDLISYYKNTTFSSATEYECHAGGTGGHLTFKATFVSLPKN